MKLGDSLLKDGKITREQLKQALDRQVIYGGRIGTNIVELGILREEEMIGLLSRYFKVSAVDPAALAAIDPETIACISAALADKYKVLPFRRDRTRLHAAMLDPRQFGSLDELRFITGYDIIPYAISELRLLFCLEKYYGIKRDLRYISVFQFEDEEGESITKNEAYLNSIREQFASVKQKEDVAGLLLSETKPFASRAVFFYGQGESVTAWKSRGGAFDGLVIPIGVDSIFFEVLKRKDVYRGPLLRGGGNEALIERLGSAPLDCCLLPVFLAGRIVAFLYVDNETDVLDASVSFINRLCAMAGYGLAMVMNREKIFEQ